MRSRFRQSRNLEPEHLEIDWVGNGVFNRRKIFVCCLCWCAAIAQSASRRGNYVLTFCITLTYSRQAPGASRLVAILARRAWRSWRVKVQLKGDADRS
jgi:hypothetical protein